MKIGFRVEEINLKYLIHKQAEFTKNNGHVSPIVYRIERSWTKRHVTLIFA